MTKLLLISANVHQDLSARQLAYCERLVKESEHDYQIEVAAAGTYEIPFIINAYQQRNPFDGYIALGLVLKTNLDHYDYIMSHIKECFTSFALNSIAVGNGIVSGNSLDELTLKIDSSDPCLSAYPSAVKAVDYLVKLKKNLSI
ncbi:6,7-dimethyl-8-ribityllumazine synthase [Legionella massiliensis]|uniref:6,7-dimethyl-8-ribityllumazine synthase n=1 Tax=Legionella massiliensis TaxID=1034943 RepID=A0A078KWZ3_9GAMM|nr:6,7-dimethyl-8-ribityllumazine synthase [Legionella massiliensis]CDZ76294.1 6,7-dimethyl-8-ribityllumazine synthase [Legionella massiliensis]CEE12032.1 6,7-dimethyl-8-ribityllumazine synthase [Legionella massiliensis]